MEYRLAQFALLQAVVATGTPTVLLVMNGRPLDLSWAAENVPAILDIWYPGTQGGADLDWGNNLVVVAGESSCTTRAYLPIIGR